jgi:hypothetical protein
MSYDLYLHRRESAGPLKKKEFQSYFKDRPRFTVKGTHAGYENEKTGVYFTFEYSDGKDADASELKASREHIHFNLNYYRSHVFGLEAERILTPLVEALDLVVSDPQTEGIGESKYTPEGFLRGWNAGNRFGHQACLALEQRGEKLIGQQHVLPAKKLRACWEWTYGIDALYDRVHADEIDVFIPQVMFALCDGALQTLCVWPQLIPTALPAVDRVLVLRDELPPRLAKGVDTANAVVPWQEVRKAASGFELVSGKGTPGLKYVLMDYGSTETAPAELVGFVRALPAFGGKLQRVTTDQILDEELVRECAPGAAERKEKEKGTRKKRGDS